MSRCRWTDTVGAFTAGVLTRLFHDDVLGRHRIVGLSGTSGGAVCALLAWEALIRDDPDRAGALLHGFWADNAATSPVDRVVNAWLVWASRLRYTVPTPMWSPYDSPAAVAALHGFRTMVERWVDFDAIEVDADGTRPLLLLGAVDVRSGNFATFNSRRERITADMVMASAAIPTLFRAVPVDGRSYWDGLFSQNPSVRELLDAVPDELWVIQINPRERESEPRTVAEISDRRNELSGNLSLHQELHFIEKINHLLDDGLLVGGDRYRTIVVRVIELARSRLSRLLGTSPKLNRDPGFIRELMAHVPTAPTSSSRRWRSSARGGSATPRRWPRASPTTPTSCRPGRPGRGPPTAVAGRSTRSSEITSSATSTSTSPASRCHRIGSRGRSGPTSTRPGRGRTAARRPCSTPGASRRSGCAPPT